MRVFAKLYLLSALIPTLAPAQEIGSRACAGCHPAIAKKYALTGMARTSSTAGAGSHKESFDRAPFTGSQGAEYQVTAAPDGYRFRFSRGEAVRGERRLDWTIGSGHVGHSYLFSVDGFLYQAPVSYFSESASWNLSPGFEKKPSIDLTRAVEPACLQCHASRLRPVAGTQNAYQNPPFAEAGISCERCHGPGAQHAARPLKTNIVNPAKLAVAQRDSVCAQCHLTGAARVARARQDRASYQPGRRFSDYVAIYVFADPTSAEVTATSHFEKLSYSACSRASAGKLWCGSCHDSHEQPAPEARAAYYRERCVACHERKPCKQTEAARAARGNDCTACHMPQGKSTSVEHIAFTDHSIPRIPRTAEAQPSASRELASFFKDSADDRDLALAYTVLAPTEPSVRQAAFRLLQQAESRNPNDVPILAQLALFNDRMGREDAAMALCERILKLDPTHVAASVNLGIYKVKRGQAAHAIELWRRALTRNPAQTGARMNLAVAQFQSGDAEAAKASLNKALEYDPDFEPARRMLAEIK